MTTTRTEDTAAVTGILGLYPGGERRWLIPVLQDIQDRFGYLNVYANGEYDTESPEYCTGD